MAVERAATLYLRNDTTVDTGTGINIRLLDDVNGGTDDVTQTITAANTEDSVLKTFEPGVTGVTAVADPDTLQKKGWALRLAEDMTPGDDTNCGVFTPAQTFTVNLDVSLAWTGAIVANPTPIFKVAVVRYNPSTDNGTVWAQGSQSQAWQALTENGTFKTVAVSVTRGSNLSYAQGETLLLQVGVNTGTLPNQLPSGGTYTFTLRINNATTRIAWAADGHPHVFCTLSGSTVGAGESSRGGLAIDEPRTVTGDGDPTGTRTVVAAKAFDVIGDGDTSHLKAAELAARSALGDGIAAMTRAVVAAKSFDAVGDGAAADVVRAVALARDTTGDGDPTGAKAVTAAKEFALDGDGVITEVHPVQAFRTFALTADGEVLMSGPNGSTITLPLDELPTGEESPTVIRPVFIFDG